MARHPALTLVRPRRRRREVGPVSLTPPDMGIDPSRPFEPVVGNPNASLPDIPRYRPWRPWKPQQPPAGTYDPTIDINLGAAQRGYGDLVTDIDAARARAMTDFLSGREGIALGARRGYQDIDSRQGELETGYGRNLTDLLTGRRQGVEDYGTRIAGLQRAYAAKGNQQLQAINARGLLYGSAQAQARARRAAGQGRDQAGLDTAQERFMDASRLAESRLGEDRTTALGQLGLARTRLGEDTGFGADGAQLASLPLPSALSKLMLDLAPPDASNPLGGRTWQDWTTQLARGGRENEQAAIDAAKVKGAQAAAAGWTPAQKPKNEFVGPDGKPYRTKREGKFVVAYGPDGRVLWRKKRAA